ncbi:MAG: ankyrin repeat domain-containing protein [Bdellovibrionales bacterium]
MKRWIVLSCLLWGATLAQASEIQPLALAQSVENDDLRAVQKAIESGQATVDQMVAAVPYGSEGISILALAARSGSVRVAEYLIKNKANLERRTAANETALMLAVYFDDSLYNGEGDFHKNDQIAKMLVDHGASFENGNFWTPLAYAGYKGRTAIAQYMLQHGAPVNGPLLEGYAPYMNGLMMAARNGHKEFVRMILRFDADPNISTREGVTAHLLAKRHRQTHLIGYIECALNLKKGEKYGDHCDL